MKLQGPEVGREAGGAFTVIGKFVSFYSTNNTVLWGRRSAEGYSPTKRVVKLYKSIKDIIILFLGHPLNFRPSEWGVRPLLAHPSPDPLWPTNLQRVLRYAQRTDGEAAVLKQQDFRPS